MTIAEVLENVHRGGQSIKELSIESCVSSRGDVTYCLDAIIQASLAIDTENELTLGDAENLLLQFRALAVTGNLRVLYCVHGMGRTHVPFLHPVVSS